MDDAAASTLLTVRIHSSDIESLRELVRTRAYDFGCRAQAIPNDDRRAYFTPALLTRDEYEEVREDGFDVDILFEGIPGDRTASATIGDGDRFEGGARAPQGLGSQGEGATHVEGGIMNVDEIGSAVKGLVNEYGIPTFSTPNPTHGGAGGGGGMVGGVNPDDYHVYFIAGVHARERGGPDQLIYFIADLLKAQRDGTGVQYGTKSYSNAQALQALSTGIVFFPLVNPDGVRWDQQTDSSWRKNRNPASASPGEPSSVGVDINRNYDFLWDFNTHFDPSVAGSSNLASESPAAPTFHGTAVFSEPESRNVAWVFEKFPRIRWFMDIHSAYGEVLYNWGDDENQAGDPDQNFHNPAWDRERGRLGVNDYREWISEGDQHDAVTASDRVAQAMRAVGGRRYVPTQACGLYATSGASDDYAFSRFHVDSGVNKVHGFTMEFGYPYNFYPTVAEFDQNVLDTGSGFMEFCLAASDIGLA